MTARVRLSQEILDHVAQVASQRGVAVKVTLPNGAIYEAEPVDKTGDSAKDAFAQWKGRREGQVERRS